jgi:hypothetical protein
LSAYKIFFIFLDNTHEKNELVANCDRFEKLKHSSANPKVEVKIYSKSHDRFLILDEKEVYHIGASLKDLGKKWFAFSKIDPITIGFDANEIMKKLSNRQ